MKLNKGGLTHLRKKEEFYGYLFAAPVILGFLLFVFLPMLISFFISLTDYAIVNKPSFIGLDNYIEKFKNADYFFYKSLGVTFYYVSLAVPLQMLSAFVTALLLNARIKGRSIFRTIFYLPTIMPVVATSLVWMWLFDPDAGLFNHILKLAGLPTSKWIWSESTVIPSVVFMSLWSVGGTMVIFLAGLQEVPRSLYESAEVDGASFMSKLLNITLPMMSPTIFFNAIMAIINAFQVFGQIYIMTNGGPNNASLMYAFYLYREAFTFSEMGRASALGWILFLIVLILTLIIFRFANGKVYYAGEDQ